MTGFHVALGAVILWTACYWLAIWRSTRRPARPTLYDWQKEGDL